MQVHDFFQDCCSVSVQGARGFWNVTYQLTYQEEEQCESTYVVFTKDIHAFMILRN